MEKITFDQLPEMVSLILQKLDGIEKFIYKHEGLLEDKEMMTSDETAKFMGVSMSYLYKLSFKRELPSYKPGGKKMYFRKGDVIDWLSKHKIMSNDEIEEKAIKYVMKHRLK
jgi:excisionase family DNA binding protein